MRPVMFGAVLLIAACAQIDSFTPTITGIGVADGTDNRTAVALPFRICDVATSFTQDQFRGKLPNPSIFAILGSGFMPKVVGATTNDGEYHVPIVTLEGPTNYTYPVAVQEGRLIFQLDYGDTPLVEGTYAVSVRNPDASESTVARLANAVRIVPPPVATPELSPVCLNSPQTVRFRGGPFVQGLRVQSSASQADLVVTVEAPDRVSVAIPAFPFASAGTPYSLTFRDPTGCTSNITISLGCP